MIGTLNLDVVAFAAEERMLLDVGGDVEVARRRAHGAGIAFAGNAQPRTVLRAGGNAHLHRLRMRAMRPSPWQVGQAFLSRPLPLQRGQVRLNFMLPAIWVTLPVPLHCGQAIEPGIVAARAVAGGALSRSG